MKEDIFEQIKNLENKIKKTHEALSESERKIVTRVLAKHADEVHIRNPDLVKQILQIIDEEIK
jgi:hypothetical protein